MVSHERAAPTTRCARCAPCGSSVELGFELDPATARGGRRSTRPRSTAWRPSACSPSSSASSPRPRVRDGLELMDAYGLIAAVLPELAALRGVEQNEFHHADVSTTRSRCSTRSPPLERGDLGRRDVADAARRAAGRRAHARRRDALRRPAARRRQAADPRRAPRRARDLHRPRRGGAELSRDVLRRLRASQRLDRLRGGAHPATTSARVPRPPSGRSTAATVWRYLRATAPWTDRRHDLHRRRPAGHPRAQRRARRSPPTSSSPATCSAARSPPARGAADPRRRAWRASWGSRPGPQLGELLAQLEEDRYAGAIATREEAIARARQLASGDAR